MQIPVKFASFSSVSYTLQPFPWISIFSTEAMKKTVSISDLYFQPNKALSGFHQVPSSTFVTEIDWGQWRQETFCWHCPLGKRSPLPHFKTVVGSAGVFCSKHPKYKERTARTSLNTFILMSWNPDQTNLSACWCWNKLILFSALCCWKATTQAQCLFSLTVVMYNF